MKIFKRSVQLAVFVIAGSQLFSSCSTSQLQSGKNEFLKNSELGYAQNTLPAPNKAVEAIAVENTAVVNAGKNQTPEASKTIALASTETKNVVKVQKNASAKTMYTKGTEKAASKKSFINKVKDVKKLNKLAGAAKPLAGDNQIIALVLCALLGTLGIHRFYLGYTWQAILQLVLFLIGIVGLFIFIGIFFLIALYIWVLIDFIRILLGKLEPKDGSYEDTLF